MRNMSRKRTTSPMEQMSVTCSTMCASFTMRKDMMAGNRNSPNTDDTSMNDDTSEVTGKYSSRKEKTHAQILDMPAPMRPLPIHSMIVLL